MRLIARSHLPVRHLSRVPIYRRPSGLASPQPAARGRKATMINARNLARHLHPAVGRAAMLRVFAEAAGDAGPEAS
jgi:hypothetical protein